MKKNIKYFVLAAGLMIFTACDDFLDTESPSKQTSETVFNNEGMTRSAIMGVYSQLNVTNVYGQKMSVNWQGNSDIEFASGFASSDALKTASGDTPAQNFWDNSNNTTTVWTDLFKLAELGSTAVEGIRNSNLIKTKPAVMKRYLGEALVMRSLAYFELARRWGDVPFRSETSSSDLKNVYMNKISRDSIYNVIIADMEEAIEYLPYIGSVADYTVERVSKGFAKGLLARIALFAGGWSLRDGNQFPDKSNVEEYSGNLPGMEAMGGYYVGRPKNWKDYYKIAEQQCAELLSDPENPHGLDPDFSNIWKTVCGLGVNPHGENLFECANGVGQNGDIGTLMGSPQDGDLGWGNRGSFGGSYASTNAYYFYSFSENDKRRDTAVTWTKFGKNSDNGNTIEEYITNNPLSLNFAKWNFFWTSDQYRAICLTATSRVPTGINWILMRYSDIYLMFAEARYNLEGNKSSVNSVCGLSAAAALEKVRERAFGAGSPEITNYDSDFMEAIMHERAWEFGCEGIRKLDLVRWGMLDKKIEDMKEALVKMLDGTNDFRIFDKTYVAGQLPTTVYYKYTDETYFEGRPPLDLGDTYNARLIDRSSANFYTNIAGGNPDPNIYREKEWFPLAYWHTEANYENENTNAIEYYCRILICASGLRASYNYDTLFSQLKYGNLIKSRYENYKVGSGGGNGVCNYRHLYAIYYEDITKSKGFLKNSYGY
ncbi:RagB/SusD family nutrient uptake outer membrane protein [Bacteroides sp. 214]|uniref:RagB/SusD family nutrient uptake outer membrane protein n=1 Tax=Bacteroides sp. 214 TaxID=2302935 RepID=UPI0013D788A3|nr:RagB/SusD family nutrient uptake outer membrane protein [Bacteroides sp. 214]NDW13646.1 RagB/SusD family nutrient uptake outer membrane protein [Bacteroides sp. 214]